MRIEDAGVGMVLTHDIFDERGNLLLEKGISLTRTYISRLKRLGIKNLHLTDPYAESLKQRKLVSDRLRAELNECFTDLFRMRAADILNFKPPASRLEKLDAVIGSTIDQAIAASDNLANLQVREPSSDETRHAVNVCLLSLAAGIYLKYERRLLHDLALGALLHDLGKSMLPRSNDDKAYLHTVFGRELLLRSNLSTVVARIAAEHHESFDGSGNPKGLTGKDIHPLSRLVCITNFFDQEMGRSVQQRTPRLEVIEQMMAGGNTAFDLNLLRAFLNTIAIFPVGSLVRLNNGRAAYVISNRSHFPLRPVVRVIDDYGHTDIDLSIKPNITITDLLVE